jgi:uncharacterized protein YbaP (TraB family)
MFSSLRRTTDRWIRFGLLGVAVLFAIPTQAVQARPKCCVWRVTNAKAPFYLVGSVHTLSEDDYPLPPPYEIALKEAKRFLFEFDPTRQAEFEKKLNAAATYPPAQDIRSKIHPELLAWLRQNILAINGDPRRGKKSRVEGFDRGLRYKPWWIAQRLVNKSAYTNVTTCPGLDDYFLVRAQKMGREIGGLESVDEHVAVLGGLSDRDGEILLRDALAPHNNGKAEFNRMRKHGGTAIQLRFGWETCDYGKRHPGLQRVLLTSETANGCRGSRQSWKGANQLRLSQAPFTFPALIAL